MHLNGSWRPFFSSATPSPTQRPLRCCSPLGAPTPSLEGSVATTLAGSAARRPAPVTRNDAATTAAAPARCVVGMRKPHRRSLLTEATTTSNRGQKRTAVSGLDGVERLLGCRFGEGVERTGHRLQLLVDAGERMAGFQGVRLHVAD